MTPMCDLMFVNPEATPTKCGMRLSEDAVDDVVRWYASHHAGDQYAVFVDGMPVKLDDNGCLDGGRVQSLGNLFGLGED